MSKNLSGRSVYPNLVAVIILCSLGIIIYSNTFQSPFQFDDDVFVRNLSLRDLSNIGAIWNYWASRFITFFTFALNYHFGRIDVFGYHLVNLVIHLGSAIAVFWLIRLILSTPAMKGDKLAGHTDLIAFFGALIFVSHPIQTESVTYIFQRSTSLAGFFYLFSLCLYIKSRLLVADGDPLSKWGYSYSSSLLLAVFAMLTKENAVTLPLMIILCEFCFFKTDKRIKWRYVLPFLVILPIIPILLFSTKPVISSDMGRMVAPTTYLDPYYFLTQFRAMITYIRLSFIPINQNLDYDYPLIKTPFDPSALASILALVIILLAAVKLFKKHRLISFSIFWFFLTILPESSLIHLKKDFIFEHWLYLPVFGYSLFIVSAAYYLLGKNSFKLMVSALIAIVACYSVLTYNRNLVWKDELTLWNDAVLKSPNKARPYLNRGNVCAEKGDFYQAISDFNKAIEINPRFAEAYNNRGGVYAKKGNLDQAISDYNRAIEINPDYAEVYSNRGSAYAKKGSLNQAMPDYNKAIEINPDYAEVYYNRGNAYLKEGSFDQAISDYSRAIKIDPQFVEVYYNRGNAYLKKDSLDQAISDFNKAIKIDPGHAKAYSNRGLSYFLKRDYGRAWEDVHKAESLGVTISPKFLEALKRASGRER